MTDADFLASQTAPVLRSFDEGLARKFYLDWLGFSVESEHRFDPEMPLYMGIHRGGLTLHLSEHYGDGTPGSAVFMRVSGLEKFHAEITARPFRNFRPGIKSQPWGREMTLIDPFGNILRFCES